MNKDDSYRLFATIPCVSCHICDDDSNNAINCERFDEWIKGDK